MNTKRPPRKGRNGPSGDAGQARERRSPEKPGLAARAAAAFLLARIVDDGRGLDGAITDPAFVKRGLSEGDARLVRAIVTTACRHRGQILHAIADLTDRPLPKNARHLHHTLHVAAAQILFMDVPDSAAVDLAVTALSHEQRSARFAPLGNAVLRRMAGERDRLLAALDPAEAARRNMPDWLFKRLRQGYGKARAQRIAEAHMLEPVLDITVMAGAGDPVDHWAERLGGVRVLADTVRTAQSGDVAALPGYDEGSWWVQDAAAALPARLLGDIAGKRVADLCAAPGGKTAQLCAMGGDVTALELSAARIPRLRGNLERLGFAADLVEGDLLDWQPDSPFDAILLDAPCSSTGTIRRHPDVQWSKSVRDVEEIAALQKRMIEKAATLLAPGGTFVFANCSIDRAEGEDIVAALDLAALGLRLDPIEAAETGLDPAMVTRQGTLRTLPFHLDGVVPPDGSSIDPARFNGLDGFFAARFVKN